MAVDVLREPLEATVAGLRSEGLSISALTADVAIPEDNQAAVELDLGRGAHRQPQRCLSGV